MIFIPAVEGSRNKRMIGGDEAEPDQFKYMVSLQADGKHTCGASIIDPQFILTAGHCVMEYDNTFINAVFTIVAGVIDATDNSPAVIRRDIEKLYVLRRKLAKDKLYQLSGDVAVLKVNC